MEIMHSKFLKLQTALLSVLLLFSVLLPQTALAEGGTTDAAAAQDTVTLVDPDTFTSWETIQGTRSITQGRIWADKTVSNDKIEFSPTSPLGKKDETVSKTDGSDFLVALSALSSTSSLTKPEPQPIDIVLVLDASGSMSDPMGRNDSTKRIDALKAAAKNFLAAAKKQNDEIEDPAKQIQVSIVKFAGNKTDKVGNATYRGEYGYTYNYSQIMRNLTLCNNAYLSTLQDVVDSISPAGATRSDYGMELAQKALGSDSARSNAKKVVIFFTDGKPTSESDYDPEVAGDAINTAKTIKGSGATIYTVGIFSGADSANPPANPSGDTQLANRFMHAVSSNYPDAKYGWVPDGWNSGYRVTMGTRAENSSYYKTATNSTELDTVFQDIFTDATSDPPVPTLVVSGKDATESGYVTFEDPLGDYMTVTDFNAIAFSDKIYTTPTKETRGNVTTYTFTGINKGNVAYPQNVDLNKIIITVTHDDDLKIGDKVKVEIPAALLPLRYYNIAQDKDGKISMEITPTYPIHVFYSVSLKTEAKQQMTSGVITDTALASYVAAHIEEDGKAYFYSNLYTDARTGKDDKGNPYTAGNTTASFVPAETNSFYYYTEDTLLYEDEDCTKPAKNVQPKTPYYYDLPYYEVGKTDATGSLEELHSRIKISIATQDEINDTLDKNDDGVYYVPKGTLKGSYPQALDNQIGGKEENTTNTASRRIDFGWDNNFTIGRLYLGNNGKIGYNTTGSLKIRKTVAKADPSYSPDAETPFRIQVALEGNGAGGTYTYTIDGNASDTHEFTNGDVITLKNGQTAEIEGLPAGCRYTVSEPNLPAGYTSSIDAPTGMIAAGKVQDTAPVVTVTNTYEPSNAVLNGRTNLAGEKILNGRAWLESDKFTFQLEAVSPKNAPMPATGDSKQVTQPEGTPQGTSAGFNFDDITYTKPGTYIYDINEIIPSNGIIGISYDSTIYRVTVTVTDDHEGHLTAAASMQNLSDKSTATLATFTNTFAAKDETLVLEAIKRFEDKDGNALTQTNGQFAFKLDKSQVDENNTQLSADHDPPMPTSVDAASNALGRVTYVLNYNSERDLHNTYYYQLSEVNNGLKNITYSNERYLIKVTFTVETEAGEAALQAHPTYYKRDDSTQKWVQLDKLDSESGMTFTNTFTGTTTAKLYVGKILAGRDWMDGDKFTFTLTAKNNAPMPEGKDANKLTITNASGSNMEDERLDSFDEITFTKPGTYEYTISEDEVTMPGFKNHPGDITATVTVTRDGNELTSTVSYKDAAGKVGYIYGYFTNTYSPDPYTVSTSVLFNASKTLKGRDWLPGENFTFVLTGDESNPVDTPMPDFCEAVANSSHTTVTLGDNKGLSFTQPGTYTYYITEKKESTPGLIYDTSKYKVVVTVEDKDADGGNSGKSGKLTGSVQYFKGTLGENGEYTFSDELGANIAAFTNTYTTEPATLNGEEKLSVTKKLVGREWGNKESFTFTIAAAGDNAENTPLPNENTLTLTKPTPDGDTATGHFGDITYTKPGKYSYTIREVQGADGTAAITQWDDTVYTVTVNVKDNGAGALEVESCTVKKSGDEGNSNSITFTNTYEASSTPTKDVTVNDAETSANGQPVKVGDKLTYSIHWVNDSIENGKFVPATVTITDQVPENTQLVTTPDNATYDDTTRTLTWTLNAAANTSGDVSFTVSVLPSASAALDPITNQAKVKIGDHESETNLVTNPTPYDPDSHKKVLDDNGKDIDNTLVSPGQVLTYQITWVAPLAAEGAETVDVVIKDTVPANTTFVLGSATDNIAPDDNGLLTWNIQGQKPGASGIVSFQVKVNDAVGDNGDITNQAFVNNKATVETTHNYLPGKTADKDANTTLKVGDELTYTIKYKNLEDAAADITVTDKVPTGTEFVSAKNGTCENGTVTWNLTGVEPGAKGTVSFTVRVTMDAVGKSIENQAEVKIGDRAPAQTTKTKNKNIEKPTSASVTLTAHKTLISDVGSHTLAADEFAFTLLDKDGNIVQTVTNDDKGNVTFGTLELDHVGEYTYTICEVVNSDLGYITYDNSRYTVTFNVDDAKNGTLVATDPVYSLDNKVVDKAEFTNHYTAELPKDASFSLTANKTLTGRSMIDGEFFFTLEDEGGNIVATASSDAEGNIQFPAVGLKNVQAAYTALLAAAEPVQPAAEPTPAEDEQPVKIEDSEQTPLETAVAANSLEDAPAVVTDAEPETDPETELDVEPETDPETEPETKPETKPAPTVDTDAVQALLTRWYTIREYAQGKDGVTYDANTYMVRVPLVDKDGTGTLTVDKDNIQFFAADGETPLDNNAVVFNNSYAAEGVDLTVTAQKQLTGRSMADGEFSFRLSCNDDPANEQTVTSDANGRIAFALHYDDKDGTGTQETHTYTVTEVRGDNDTITYDDTAYTFTVEVIDDGTGHLTTKVTQPEAMVFRNVYTPKATSITLAGNKVLNGRAQKAGEFTFELCDANGAVIATAANGENGYFAFPALSYDEAGEYTYTVREKDTGVGRVTYDKTVYSVTVQVRDEDGQLKADIILPASGLTFTNTYTPEPAQTPAPTPKPTTSPAPAATAAPTPAPARIPQTADSFPLALLIGLLAVSGGALAVLLTARKRGKK